jgi:hypothetical protein
MCTHARWSHGSYASQQLRKHEATWEREEELKVEFPSFFSDPSESRG